MPLKIQRISLDAKEPPCIHCILHEFAGPLVQALMEAYPPTTHPNFGPELLKQVAQFAGEVLGAGANSELPKILPTLVKIIQDRAIEAAEEVIDGQTCQHCKES